VLAGAVDATLFGGLPVASAATQAVKGDKKGAATTLATGGAKKAVDAGVEAVKGAKVVKKAVDSADVSMPEKTAEQIVSERISTAPNVSEEVRRQLAEDRFELSAKQRRELLKDLSPAEVKEELAFKKASTLMQSPDLTRQMIRRGALGEGTKRNLAAFGRSALDEFDKMGAGDVESSTMLLDSGFGKGRVSPFTGRITYGDPEARAFYQELAALDSGPAAVDPVVERLGGGPAIGISEDVMAQAVSPGRIQMPSPVFIPEPSLDAPTMEQFNAQELARQQLAEDRQSQAVLGQMQKLAEQATQAESRLMGQGGGAAPVSSGIGEYDNVYGQQLAASNPNNVQGNMLSQAASAAAPPPPTRGMSQDEAILRFSNITPGELSAIRQQQQVIPLEGMTVTASPPPTRMMGADEAITRFSNITPEELNAIRQQQQVIPLEGMTVTASPPAQVNQLSPLNLTEDVFSSEPYAPRPERMLPAMTPQDFIRTIPTELEGMTVTPFETRLPQEELRSGRFGEERGMPMQSNMVVPGQVTDNIDVRPPLMNLSEMAGPRPIQADPQFLQAVENRLAELGLMPGTDDYNLLKAHFLSTGG
jgi:hypothetical protein